MQVWRTVLTATPSAKASTLAKVVRLPRASEMAMAFAPARSQHTRGETCNGYWPCLMQDLDPSNCQILMIGGNLTDNSLIYSWLTRRRVLRT